MPLTLDQVVALAHDHGGSTWFSREAAIAPDAGASEAWKVLSVDVSRVAGVDDLMSVIARDWELPPYFGSNWDALEDVISDESWNAGKSLLFAVRGAAAAAEEPSRRSLLVVLVEVLEAALADRITHGGAGACTTVLLDVDEQSAPRLQQHLSGTTLRNAETDSSSG